MANLVWVEIVRNLQPVVNYVNILAAQTLTDNGYEVGILALSVGLAFLVKKQMRLPGSGILQWIILTVVFYGFFMALGFGVLQPNMGGLNATV